MANFLVLLCASLAILANFALAFPVPFGPVGPRRGSWKPWKPWFCSSHSWMNICPRQAGDTVNVFTPLGVAHGIVDNTGATRFSVQYASADRWEHSSVATSWNLPDGSSDPAALPKMCAQIFADPASVTEDCLSMILYVPPNLHYGSNVPTMVWIHGGSFILGSATAAGIDGAKLAVATNSIVAVMQYRLGALGFMAPDGKTNLPVEDSINALKFVKKVIRSFGGSTSKVTIAGQSSGATMVRGLLAAPSASSYFKGAILQSDTMDAGFLAPAVQSNLQANFNGLIGCSDSSCYSSLALSTILDNTLTQFFSSGSIEPSATEFAPMRPVKDGSLISSSMTSSGTFPQTNKPILVTTVENEAGKGIYGTHTSALSQAQFIQENVDTFGQTRANTIIASPNYDLPLGNDGQVSDARPQLEMIGTDYIWKCSAWTFARNWASNGGNVYVGMYTSGATYPSNSDIGFCTENGTTCHEDDIEIVFGNVQDPSADQSALVTEMQARYKSFLNNGNPNAAGYSSWSTAGSSNVNPLNLGGTGTVPVGACDPSFWGDAVQYDYQVYNA